MKKGHGEKFERNSGYSDLDKDVLVAECAALSSLNPINVIAKENGLPSKTLRTWVKASGAKLESENLKQDIVKQCTASEISPAKLADLHGCSSNTIRNIVKKEGGILPGTYSETAVHTNNEVELVMLSCPKANCDYVTAQQGYLERHLKSK